jgi:hypothetical protein
MIFTIILLSVNEFKLPRNEAIVRLANRYTILPLLLI